MELVLKAAFERDVDLVLVRAFYEGNSVSQHFLSDGDRVLEVHHSAMKLATIICENKLLEKF